MGGLAFYVVCALVAGGALGSLVCFIVALIHYFRSNQAFFAVVCILLSFVFSIGVWIAFVKGWMDNIGKVMWIWSAFMAATVLGYALLFLHHMLTT